MDIKNIRLPGFYEPLGAVLRGLSPGERHLWLVLGLDASNTATKAAVFHFNARTKNATLMHEGKTCLQAFDYFCKRGMLGATLALLDEIHNGVTVVPVNTEDN